MEHQTAREDGRVKSPVQSSNCQGPYRDRTVTERDWVATSKKIELVCAAMMVVWCAIKATP